MLVLMLAAVLLTQDPTPDRSWVLEGGDDRRPTAVVVSGAIELTRSEARSSARRIALEQQQEMWQQQARTAAMDRAPVWMPSFVREQVVHSFLQRQRVQIESSLRIHDEDIKVRDHGFGPSYQSTLLVDPDTALFDRARRDLESGVERRAKRFVAECGGLVGLWAVLGLLTAWLDRLSRGYMTWRLRLLACGIGGSVLALVLVA